MKIPLVKKFLTLLLSLPTLLAFSQDTTFLDNDLNKVASKQIATHYRILERDQTDINRIRENTYFKSGQLKTQEDYSVYRKRELDGKAKEWFESGQIRRDIDYKKGKKHGQLLTYWENGALKRVDKFENGEFIEGKCMNSDGSMAPHFAYEIFPEFPGGEDQLLQYIGKEVKYPKMAIRMDTEGKVLTYFIVEKDGVISDVKIRESVSKELDAEAIRVVAKMPNWKPGLRDGESVKFFYSLPIDFRLR